MKIQEMTVEGYDPQWPALYEEEKERILRLIGDRVAGIEHIGSTAVPGLPAKPMIDIMIGVDEISVVESWHKPLAELGYAHEFSRPHWCHFIKIADEPGRGCNIHIYIHGDDIWTQNLRFRGYLRAHPDVAEEYRDLKLSLARKYRYVPEGYAMSKSNFIKAVMRKARE